MHIHGVVYIVYCAYCVAHNICHSVSRYFLHYVVLLSCVPNLHRMVQRAENNIQPPLPACLHPVHCVKEVKLTETEDTCTYLFIKGCGEEARDQKDARSTFLPQVVRYRLSLNYSFSHEQHRNTVAI